jgi:mannose-6-phosphate isomerase-like protein (cupin superfamily)
MQIVHADSVFQVEPGTIPNYNRGNSLVKLVDLMENVRLAASRELYLGDSLQFLFPFESLDLYGPSAPDTTLIDPTKQDNKTDFQKQNVRDFRTGDTQLMRGYVTLGDWTGAFLRLSYRAGPDSRLAAAASYKLDQSVKLWLKVGATTAATLLTVPYNPVNDRYEIELWSYAGSDLRSRLDEKGQRALDSGELVARPDLVRGDLSVFRREGLDDQYIAKIATDHTMHPILPLTVQVAWADSSGQIWDSQGGANYTYAFNMVVRGWNNYLGVGISPNPHGGVGFLEYRNLLSNYGRYEGSNELGRTLEPWNFNAWGSKNHGGARENFMAVDYMDLHILQPNCGIGLHRHRDNQEIFFMLEGQGLMAVGDWCKMPDRERCIELRTLRPGHFAMLKGGNLHGLMNPTDEPVSLFMFGGYD